MRSWLVPALAIFGSFFALEARSHPLDVGYLQLSLNDERIQAVFQLNPAAAARFAGSENTQKFFLGTIGGGSFTLNGADCRWGEAKISRGAGEQSENLEIQAAAECAGASESEETKVEIHLPFLVTAESSYRIFGRLSKGEAETTFLLEPSHPKTEILLKTSGSFWGFVLMGIEHIGAWPSQWHDESGWRFPEGLDHILFVLALVLGGGSGLALVRTVSGFTLGHTVTLALAAMNVVHFPGKLAEILIALSIVYVAVSAFLGSAPAHRWRVAIFFGIFHGFGFASALEGLSLSKANLVKAILGFNVGVELGQLVIIACVLPLLFLLKQSTPRAYSLTLRGSSLCIALAGSYWLFERMVG